MKYTAQKLANEFDKNWEGVTYEYRFWQYSNILNIDKEIAQKALEILKEKRKFLEN